MATTAAQLRAAEPAPALDERYAALAKLVEKVPADSAQRTRWRAQLATAFRAVAARERVTRRHAVIRRILHRWPEAGQQLLAR